MLNQSQEGLDFSCWAPVVQQQELVESVQLFQYVLYVIVINESKTGQLGPLLLAGSYRNGWGEPMHALTVSLEKVAVVSDSIRFWRDRGERVHSTENVPFDAIGKSQIC